MTNLYFEALNSQSEQSRDTQIDTYGRPGDSCITMFAGVQVFQVGQHTLLIVMGI